MGRGRGSRSGQVSNVFIWDVCGSPKEVHGFGLPRAGRDFFGIFSIDYETTIDLPDFQNVRVCAFVYARIYTWNPAEWNPLRSLQPPGELRSERRKKNRENLSRFRITRHGGLAVR